MVIPGLTGGKSPSFPLNLYDALVHIPSASYESYIKSILIHVIKPVERGGLGYRAVVFHHRGCKPIYMCFILRLNMLNLFLLSGGGVPVTSPRLYSAGGTDDFRQALTYICHRYPRAILLGLAFSLGSNIMTRYIAQEGEKSRLSSACVLANVRRSLL